MKIENTPTTESQPQQFRFNSLEKIVKDNTFQRFVREKIDQIRTERRNRKNPYAGYHYKKDWYDRMREAEQLRPQFFLDHIESIWKKKSLLNAETRSVIREVCDMALAQTLIDHNKKLAELKKETAL